MNFMRAIFTTAWLLLATGTAVADEAAREVLREFLNTAQSYSAVFDQQLTGEQGELLELIDSFVARPRGEGETARSSLRLETSGWLLLRSSEVGLRGRQAVATYTVGVYS